MVRLVIEIGGGTSEDVVASKASELLRRVETGCVRFDMDEFSEATGVNLECLTFEAVKVSQESGVHGIRPYTDVELTLKGTVGYLGGKSDQPVNRRFVGDLVGDGVLFEERQTRKEVDGLADEVLFRGVEERPKR